MTEPRDIKDRTFEFATRIVRLCRALEESPGVSRTLANQLLRSGTSVGANVEEAHGSHSKPDFIAKMSIANKAARETNYWLRLLAAADVIPINQLTGLTDESNQLVAILTTIVKRSRVKSEMPEQRASKEAPQQGIELMISLFTLPPAALGSTFGIRRLAVMNVAKRGFRDHPQPATSIR